MGAGHVKEPKVAEPMPPLRLYGFMNVLSIEALFKSDIMTGFKICGGCMAGTGIAMSCDPGIIVSYCKLGFVRGLNAPSKFEGISDIDMGLQN
jgi:hypothetical protein